MRRARLWHPASALFGAYKSQRRRTGVSDPHGQRRERLRRSGGRDRRPYTSDSGSGVAAKLSGVGGVVGAFGAFLFVH